jgi:hypothetical protein
MRKLDVVHVLTDPANQSGIFAPLDASADRFTDGHDVFSEVQGSKFKAQGPGRIER